MKSPNLYQHHLHDQFVGSSSLTTPSGYGTGSTHGWTQNTILKTDDINVNYNGVFLNARNRSEALTSPLNCSMVQDLGFHWNGSTGPTFTNQSTHDLQLTNINKGLELSESLPKFSEMSVKYSPSSVKNEQMDLNYDLSKKLLLETITSDFPVNGNQSSGEIYTNESIFGSAVPGRGNFSQIYPSVNISNINQSVQSSSSSSISGPFDMNLEVLDLLNSTKFSGGIGQQYSCDNRFLFKENLASDFHIVQPPSLKSPFSSSKASSFNGETTETKRANSLLEPKTTQAAPKKSRLETRATCPPFKVRKEKLGDRIAALQQLVAPFGKTDTASVLMEATGYIKFLQNQVETLIVPFMKSSRSKGSTATPMGSTARDGNEAPIKDLRSRGLCLVPLSCMSYVTNDGGGGGGGIWPPPNFGGGI